MNMKALLALAALASASLGAIAGPVTSGFDTTTLESCDDCYSDPVALGFTANFFGTSYDQTYVSNNGYVTFNAGQGIYTPTGLTAAYSGNPIIAAFFADVDTRTAGTTTYGTGTYAGQNAFGVTYTGVGYYSEHSDKLNTFQLILVDRSNVAAGDFDVYFNYDQVQWETGDVSGGSGGLGGSSAAVGYANGSGVAGTYDQLDGSLTPGAFLDGGPDALTTHSNDGVVGQYLFQVRNGTVTIPPVSSVPEPANVALLLAGLGTLALVRRRRS